MISEQQLLYAGCYNGCKVRVVLLDEEVCTHVVASCRLIGLSSVPVPATCFFSCDANAYRAPFVGAVHSVCVAIALQTLRMLNTTTELCL